MKIRRAPFDEHAATLLNRAVRRLFARQRKRVLHSVHDEWARRGIGKAADDDRSALWFWDDDAPEQQQAVNEMAESLRAAAASSGTHTFNAMRDPVHELPEGEVTAQDISNRLVTFATDYATQRAAELVSGINETTRDKLNVLVRNAVALHWSTDELADRLTDTGAFNDSRAEMIARTETSAAQNAATLEMGKLAVDRGIDLKKGWTLGDDPCPICIAAAKMGIIEVNADFGDAGDGPPLHPNCMCVIDLYAPDEEARKHASEGMRTHKRMTPMDTTAPVVKIAKAFADSGRSFMTETELTEKIFEYAQASRLPNESPHQAFARVFAGNTPEAVVFRKAVAVCKTADVRPLGSDDADAARAYAKLQRLAEQHRQRHPHLSPEQCFSKVFCDPENKALADQAHQRPIAVW